MNDIFNSITQIINRLAAAEAEVGRLNGEIANLGTNLISAETRAAAHKRELEEMTSRALRAEKEFASATATLNMYANAWQRELGPFIASKAHEIDALVVGTRNLRELLDSRTAQGQADHRALHDALGWAHEWHGKELPSPSRAVAEIIAKVNSATRAEVPVVECGDTQSTSSFGPVRCRLQKGHEGEHVDNITAASKASKLPGARIVWPQRCDNLGMCDLPRGHTGAHHARTRSDEENK